MTAIARIGDQATGTCRSHRSPRSVTGTISTGRADVMTEGSPTATVGDTVTFNCGHTGIIDSGTVIASVKDKPIAIIGSHVTAGSGAIDATIVSGANNVTAI